MVYLDDIVIFSNSFEEHLQNVRIVLDVLNKANLRISPAKCVFGCTELILISQRMVSEPQKINFCLWMLGKDPLSEISYKNVQAWIGVRTSCKQCLRQYYSMQIDLTIDIYLNNHIQH
jgi:hypothetical protein